MSGNCGAGQRRATWQVREFGRKNLTSPRILCDRSYQKHSKQRFGLMHVAAAFAVPQIAIFGSSSPLHTPPLNERASVLWLKTQPDYQPPLDCAPVLSGFARSATPAA